MRYHGHGHAGEVHRAYISLFSARAAKKIRTLIRSVEMPDNECMVSVLCTAYNHEQYLRECLDGFISQETDFPFEVLVNDDCSADATAAVIRDYAAKYPEIIRPFYQKENLL